jgi:hypothetical protein
MEALMTTDLSKTNELTAKQRETAKLWASKIIADQEISQQTGARQRYDIATWCETHGDHAIMDCPHPSGKPLRECTRLDLTIGIEAYAIVSAHYATLAEATRLLAAEGDGDANPPYAKNPKGGA